MTTREEVLALVRAHLSEELGIDASADRDVACRTAAGQAFEEDQPVGEKRRFECRRALLERPRDERPLATPISARQREMRAERPIVMRPAAGYQ